MEINKERLLQLINSSLTQRFDSEGNGEAAGLIGLMSNAGKAVMSDVPAVFETISLLNYYLEVGADIHDSEMISIDEIIRNKYSSVIINQSDNKVVLKVNIDAGDFPYIAHWCSDSLYSETVRNKPGAYLLPFYIEECGDQDLLFPDWCQAFYVDSVPGQCLPMLALKSIESVASFNGDFAEPALHRLSMYTLPVEEALREMKKNAPQTGA